MSTLHTDYFLVPPNQRAEKCQTLCQPIVMAIRKTKMIWNEKMGEKKNRKKIQMMIRKKMVW